MKPAGTYLGLPEGLAPVFVRIYEAARPMLATRGNDVHVQISLQFAMELMEREGGDPRVVIPAVILHDVGWSEVPEKQQRRAYGPGSTDGKLNRLHEQAGVRLAREILRDQRYHPVLTAEICRIIAGHDSIPTAETVGEAVVKDVDKLWRVSKEGLPVTMAILPDLTVQQIHDFVAVRVPRWFLTVTGHDAALRELAARREEYGLGPAPDIPPPGGYGIGDRQEYAT